ncbi:MAG: glycosyltransferase family 2 protein [Gemmatimonadota bacterium]
MKAEQDVLRGAGQIRQALRRWVPDGEPAAAPSGWAREVTIVATTFMRPRCVLQLLTSIRRFYPAVPVLVCDASPEPLFANGTVTPPNVTWLTPPPEAGHTVGAARNLLIQHVRTKYFFLADDDHVFNPHTDLQAMYGILERHGYDLVGGCQGRDDYGTATFEQLGDVVYQHFYRHRGLIEPGVVRCDRVSNTYLARTEAVRQVLWEPRVYANEHAEFFLRATRHGLKIAQMAGVYVDHRRDCERAAGLLGRLFGRFLPHRDRAYHRLMVKANLLGLRSKAARDLEKRYCFEKNGIRRIESVVRAAEKTALKRLLAQS